MTNEISRTDRHTPGPWDVRQESVCPEWSIVVATGGRIVANVNSETGPDIPPLVSTKMPREANARLIAAAPEMLEALREVVTEDGANCLAYGTDTPAFRRRIAAINTIARAAIAKAEGGAE